MKWFKEYNVMLLNSDLKTDKYVIEIDSINTDIAFMLCQSHMYSIFCAFQELVKSHYYSMSANLVERELRDKGEIEWSNYWKYDIKNYHFRNVIPYFYSILDYIGVMINELSKGQLIKNEKQVYFHTIKNLLSDSNKRDSLGWLSNKDIKILNEIFIHIFVGISNEEKEILKHFRNTSTHRYLVGIDEMTVFIHREKVTEKDKQIFGVEGDFKYSVKGKPKFKFDDLAILAEKLIHNLDLVISKLVELDIINNVVKLKNRF